MSSPKPLTSAQIRAARALIRWSAQELANASSVGVTTIRRAELTQSETKLTRANDQAIRRALEAAGSNSSMRKTVRGRGRTAAGKNPRSDVLGVSGGPTTVLLCNTYMDSGIT